MYLATHFSRIWSENSFSSFSVTIWGKARELVSRDTKDKLKRFVIKKSAPLDSIDVKLVNKSMLYSLVWFPFEVVADWLQIKKSITDTSNVQVNSLVCEQKVIGNVLRVVSANIPPALLKYAIPEIEASFRGAKDQELSHIHVYSSGAISEPLSFSFAACDWHVFYELGVASALTQLLRDNILRESYYLGSSTGSIVAFALAMNVSIERLKDALGHAMQSQTFNSTSNAFDSVLKQLVPSDVSMLQDRLLVSLTSAETSQNILKNTYTSKHDLIDTLCASCYVPLMYQTPKRINDLKVIGGIYSDSLPIKDCITITVSPFGNSNISPKSGPEQTVDGLFSQGLEDGIEWLTDRKRNGTLDASLFK